MTCYKGQYCHVLVTRRGVLLGIGNTELLQLVNISNSYSLADLYTHLQREAVPPPLMACGKS
jgi:hypothetical protein